MRQLILFLLASLLCLSCSNRQYRIDGIFTADNGTEVYLIDLEAADTLGVTTVRDGKFSFTGTIGTPTYVYVGRGKERVRFILEPGLVTADIDERTESGTPMIEAYNAFHKQFYGYSRTQREEKAAFAEATVRANADNLVGGLALEDLAHVDTARFMACYAFVSPRVRSFSLVRKAHEAIDIQNRTSIGRPFTDYTVPGGNPDGSDVRLSDYVGRGKFILLDHWASWCGPCKAEMPMLKKTWEAFRGERFELVSIAVSDKREDTIDALSRLDMPWIQIYDGQKIPQQYYGINAIPHLILFAPDGTILARGMRGEQIYETVSEALSK